MTALLARRVVEMAHLLNLLWKSQQRKLWKANLPTQKMLEKSLQNWTTLIYNKRSSSTDNMREQLYASNG